MKTKKNPASRKWERIAQNLKRRNGTYYGEKKIAGRIVRHSLETSDRQKANRDLAAWLKKMDETDHTQRDVTVARLFAKFLEMRGGMAPGTVRTEAGALLAFERNFKPGMNTLVASVKPSDVAAVFVALGRKLKGRSFNEYRRIVRAAFKLAIKDKIIAENPLDLELVAAKKKDDVIRNIPSREEWPQIVANIRAARKNPFADDSADFVEFLGGAAVGQAEASALKWEDVDWKAGKINLRRVKTKRPYTVPIFSWVRSILERRQAAAGINPTGKIFNVKACDMALAHACKRLSLPKITQRNLRSMRIVRWLEDGVAVKQIAEWQAHRDGGKLIWETYSNVIRRDDYEAEQVAIAEGKGKIVRFHAEAA